jgi:glucose-1-phosphate cytidylyltransferase
MTLKPSDIPVFILAGGLGTRLSEETTLKPKPMIEIGDSPILLHIMRYYYSFGFNDFVVCAGYKANEIKKYFLDYQYMQSHLAIDHRQKFEAPLSFGSNQQHTQEQEKWKVRIIDTGLNCMTGARVARAFDEIASEQQIETFALTYGDGLTDADLSKELAFHQAHGKVGTVLGVHPLARFGELEITKDGEVSQFLEKPQSKQGFINGGFFFLQGAFRSYLKDTDDCILERNPLVKLASDRELRVFKHEGFWQPMDTLRDKMILQEHWAQGKVAWKRR